MEKRLLSYIFSVVIFIFLLMGCVKTKITETQSIESIQTPIQTPPVVAQPIEKVVGTVLEEKTVEVDAGEETNVPTESNIEWLPVKPKAPVVEKPKVNPIYNGKITHLVITKSTGEYTGIISNSVTYNKVPFRTKNDVRYDQKVKYTVDKNGNAILIFEEVKPQEIIELEKGLFGKVVDQQRNEDGIYVGYLLDIGENIVRSRKIPYTSPVVLSVGNNVVYKMQGDTAVVLRKA